MKIKQFIIVILVALLFTTCATKGPQEYSYAEAGRLPYQVIKGISNSYGDIIPARTKTALFFYLRMPNTNRNFNEVLFIDVLKDELTAKGVVFVDQNEVNKKRDEMNLKMPVNFKSFASREDLIEWKDNNQVRTIMLCDISWDKKNKVVFSLNARVYGSATSAAYTVWNYEDYGNLEDIIIRFNPETYLLLRDSK